MRYIISILLLLAYTTTASQAQWTAQNSGTTVTLNGIRFVDENNGYCIGNDGIFLKTVDGGDIWTKKVFFTAEAFQDLHFVNSNLGFICSNNHIYKTTDGGGTFTEITNLLQHPDTPSKMMDDISISFKDSVGIITAMWYADTAISLKTTNGGNSWLPISMPGINIDDVHFSIVNTNVIYLVAITNQFKSIDGGITWSLIRTLPWVVGPDRGFKIFDTTGIGYASCGYETKFVCFYSDNSDTSVDNGTNSPQSYSFLDTATGFYLRGPQLFRTDDRGVTKTLLHTFPGDIYQFRHLYFIDTLTGFVCGQNGLIYKTTNGGGTNSINNLQLKKKLKIFPNPTNRIVNLDYESNVNIQCIKLYDVSGKVIKEFKKSDKVLNISDLSSGVYMLNIQTKEGNTTEQIILK